MFIVDDWFNEMDKIPKQTELHFYGSKETIQLLRSAMKDFCIREQFNKNVQPAPGRFFKLLQSIFN